MRSWLCCGVLIVVTFFSVVAFLSCIGVVYINFIPTNIRNDDTYHYAPFKEMHLTTMDYHSVKFHIVPERKGLSISAVSYDKMFPSMVVGVTNGDSDVVLDLSPYLEYEVSINGNYVHCKHKITPTQSDYLIRCPK